jgi:hypothetical protein
MCDSAFGHENVTPNEHGEMRGHDVYPRKIAAIGKLYLYLPRLLPVGAILGSPPSTSHLADLPVVPRHDLILAFERDEVRAKSSRRLASPKRMHASMKLQSNARMK